MGSEAQTIREARTRVAAHYQVSDLVVRRDWYSLANVFAAGEVSESDWQAVQRLLATVTTDEWALLGAQLQLAGVCRPIVLKELTDRNQPIAIAGALEISRCRYYLQEQDASNNLYNDAYKRRIEKELRRTVSYTYTSQNISKTIRATHQLLDGIKQGTISSSEWRDALMIILRRDPLLLTGLVDDGIVSLQDAGDALDRTMIAPIDAIRLLTQLPHLIEKDRLSRVVDRIDLGAIAQLRDELPAGIIRTTLSDRAAVLLSDAVSSEDTQVSRYTALYSNEHPYVDFRQRRLRATIEQLAEESLAELRGCIESVTERSSIETFRDVPLLQEYDVVEALQFFVLLGSRFDWASAYADRLFLDYDQWFTESQRIALLNDEASVVQGRNRKKFDHLNARLLQFSKQFTTRAEELLQQAPALFAYTNKIASGRLLHKDDLVVLACLSTYDTELHTQTVRRLNEHAFCELLNLSIEGSSLAKEFWRALYTTDALYLILRWGNRARNGYILRLMSEGSARRYSEICREMETRGIEALGRDNIDAVLAVLAEMHEVINTVSYEESISFTDQLITTYGAEQAMQFLRAARIYHAKQLTQLSPFYVKLLIDMYNEDIALEWLQGHEATLTYEQARAIRSEHYRQTQSFASKVVQSLQRSLSEANIINQEVATEAA